MLKDRFNFFLSRHFLHGIRQTVFAMISLIFFYIVTLEISNFILNELSKAVVCKMNISQFLAYQMTNRLITYYVPAYNIILSVLTFNNYLPKK